MPVIAKKAAWKLLLGLSAAAVLASPAAAQQAGGTGNVAPPPGNAPYLGTQGAPAANPADVGSIDAIMAAVYDVLSGPAGKKRDWDRMRSLFVKGARMMPYDNRGLFVSTVDHYIASTGPHIEKMDFYELEIGRKVEEFRDIAHVFSTYEVRSAPNGPAFLRGLNSFQLVRHGGRWWVASIMWQAESPDAPVPPRYLDKKKG